MLGEAKNISNLGVKPVHGECSFQVFRMKNGQSAEARYKIGTIFEIEDDSSSKGATVIGPDGIRLWVPAGEWQCFQEVDSTPK